MITKTAEALRRNRYEVSVFETKEEAAAYLAGLFHGEVIGFGASQTLAQLKLFRLLSENNTVYDPMRTKDNDEFLNVAKKALVSDYFFTSVNGLSSDGVMINLDDTGNRVAGSLFGHKKVFFVIGRNKIASTAEEALYRVRNVAAPKNAKRLGYKTPCAIEGDRCYNCSSPNRICNGLMIYLRKMSDIDMEVILINEDLGL